MKNILIFTVVLLIASASIFASGQKEIHMYIDFDQNDVITDGRLDGTWIQKGDSGVRWTAIYTFNGSQFLYEIHSTGNYPFQTYHGDFILTSTHIHFNAIKDENWPYTHSVTKWSQEYKLIGNVLELKQTNPYRFQNGNFIKQ